MKFPNIHIGVRTYCPEPRLGLGEEPTFIRYYAASPVECDDTLVIGNYCSISHDVNFLLPSCGADHQNNSITTFPLQALGVLPKNMIYKTRCRTIIGNDVWIGQGAKIMPGVEIENGAIIAAFSVITKCVPSFAMVAGNPAKIKKFRFFPHQINALNEIKWWDWPESVIKERIDDFTLPIEQFIAKYRI